MNNFAYYNSKVPASTLETYVSVNNIRIHPKLHDLVAKDILPSLNHEESSFWKKFAEIVAELMPENLELLSKRDSLQEKINNFYASNPGVSIPDQAKFLKEIGYIQTSALVLEYRVTSCNIDDEIARQPGPQLVVPVDNARYVLNAANARWGSLLNALYGTDAILPLDSSSSIKEFDEKRASAIFDYVFAFLDKHFPLENNTKHSSVTKYDVIKRTVSGADQRDLVCYINGENSKNFVKLQNNSAKFVGYKPLTITGKEEHVESIILKNNDLHVELVFDRNSDLGKMNPSGIKDVNIESALTAICDCEDSVASVDADDKAMVYKNWNGLMKGDLCSQFTKGGEAVLRKLNPDKTGYISRGNSSTYLWTCISATRACIVTCKECRNSHVYRCSYLGRWELYTGGDSRLHDLQKKPDPLSSSSCNSIRNSRTGSVYIVKPKLHGAEEVAFTIKLFEKVEVALDMPCDTLKIGVMDEERRTTVNLGNCIKEAKSRLVFINTGFLDRTGDEIHTCMEAGPMLPKSGIKTATWRVAYENWNVDHGLAAQLPGKGQIGKGMWAIPDQMKRMLETKIAHPQSGATTAWVPSPTAATLHALHYHMVSVLDIQQTLVASSTSAGGGKGVITEDALMKILTPPIIRCSSSSSSSSSENALFELSSDVIMHELKESAQSILGYVVRWIEFGVGCSKVPDLNDVGLMEDRATLRISSQLLANWLRHGIITEPQLIDTFKEMAVIVDHQNSKDVSYQPMSPNFSDSIAFQASLDLCTAGCKLPNGYTEPILCEARRKMKSI